MKARCGGSVDRNAAADCWDGVCPGSTHQPILDLAVPRNKAEPTGTWCQNSPSLVMRGDKNRTAGSESR